METEPDWLPTACNSGPGVGIAFLLLSGLMAIAGIGWFRRRHWGWRLAVAIIAVQVLGDLVNFLRGDFILGRIGSITAGALLWYLFSENVKKIFAGSDWMVSIRIRLCI